MRIMASGAGSSINLRQNKRQRHYTYRVNVTAPFVFIREIAPLMMRQGWGVIINIASRNAMVSSKGSAAYDSSKAALVALTRTVAGELAPYGIRVNAVCPGVINTPAN
jgi:NAD(P)-dependent dehydrogenase (short-subunit alcohol dehydrogenase family)